MNKQLTIAACCGLGLVVLTIIRMEDFRSEAPRNSGNTGSGVQLAQSMSEAGDTGLSQFVQFSLWPGF